MDGGAPAGSQHHRELFFPKEIEFRLCFFTSMIVLTAEPSLLHFLWKLSITSITHTHGGPNTSGFLDLLRLLPGSMEFSSLVSTDTRVHLTTSGSGVIFIYLFIFGRTQTLTHERTLTSINARTHTTPMSTFEEPSWTGKSRD